MSRLSTATEAAMGKNGKYWLVYRVRARWRVAGRYQRAGGARQAARLMPRRTDAYVVPCGVLATLRRHWRASARRRRQ
jgi:hypothetical protein